MKPLHFALYLFLAAFCFLSIQAQECGVIYITPNGATTGIAGTKTNPANLTYGLQLHSSTDSILWLAEGTYQLSNSLSIPSDIIMEGGFNASSWIKSNANTTTLQRDTSNSDIANKALVGLEIINQQNVRIQDLNITIANAPRPQFSVYGIRLSNSSDYNIVRCNITTGTGANGSNGADASGGLDGANGGHGVQGDDDNDNYYICGGIGGIGGGTTGGTGGTAGCSGSQNGGHGAAPADRCGGGGGGAGAGGGQEDDDGGHGGFGGGWSGNNTNRGIGGDASGWCNSTSSCNTSLSGSDGGNGGAGGLGGPGGNGPVGTHATGFFIPGAQAPQGQCGEGGKGGAGGGGGAGEGNPFCDDGTGSTGAGGGGGGEGGHGGEGGTGGGSAYAIYIFNNGANGNIIDCDLNPGGLGGGGTGGQGGQGGQGGIGGNGAPWFDSDLGCSGDGGNGGPGGSGGPGGTGSNGQSVQVYEHPGGANANVSGVSAVPGNPPVISVDYNGCPNTAISFSSPTSGSWNFGTDATPTTASGTAASTQYSSLGRKTIQFNGTDFTDYIHIFNSGIPDADFIQPSDTALVVGCPYQFSSTLAGSFYDWEFGSGVNPISSSGSNMQFVDSVSFSTPGTYQVQLTVTLSNACCNSAVDYATITVIPNPLNLTLSALPASVCLGDSLTISATPAIFTSYEFFVNGVSVQNSSTNKLISTTLLPTDNVVVIGLQGDCHSNPSPVLVPPITVGPIVNLFVSDDTICPGQFVTFTAVLVNYQNYEWYDNGTPVQSGSSFLHITNALQSGNSIYVQADNGGCPGFPSNAIGVVIEPSFSVNLGPDTALCPGETIVLDAGYPGSTYLWNNGSTNQTLAVSSNGLFSVVVTDGSGCNGTDSIDVMLPVPIPAIDTIVWTGIKSTDWFNPCNWDKITLPDTSLHVIIPGGTPFNPTIFGDTATCKTVTTFHQNGAHVIYDYGSGGKLLKQP